MKWLMDRSGEHHASNTKATEKSNSGSGCCALPAQMPTLQRLESYGDFARTSFEDFDMNFKRSGRHHEETMFVVFFNAKE